MSEWLINNWASLLGSVSISGITGWFLGGKQQKMQELQKGNVELESSEVDYAFKVKQLYESLLDQSNKDKENFRSDRDAIAVEFKNEREYFRNRIDEQDKKSTMLQEQFNSIQLAYAKEVELGQNSEKKYRELLDKYNVLSKDYETLKAFCEELKKELDKKQKM